VVVFELGRLSDSRGFFVETFQADRYASWGAGGPFVQDNVSRSSQDVLQGLHLQNPNPQSRLVSVLRGTVMDVAVDVT
jgi:dTDP-4-dehydrorhamnose 3,5-epimerase